MFLLRKEKDRFEENSFRDEKSPHLGRQLLAMSAIRTKFDEFCLIDPRTKTKFRRGKEEEDEVSEHCLLFDLLPTSHRSCARENCTDRIGFFDFEGKAWLLC